MQSVVSNNGAKRGGSYLKMGFSKMTLKLKPRERGETDTIDKNLIPSWEGRKRGRS